MSGDKETTLRLGLDAKGYKRGLSEVSRETRRTTDGIASHMASTLSNAGRAGIDALKSTLSGLKSAALGFAGIAGGLGIVEFGQRALASEAQLRKLAFQVRAGTGAMLDWRKVQKDAQKTALDTGHTTEQVTKSIADLYAAVGDVDFAQKAASTVAMVSTGAHESIETVTNLAGTLNEKFGITSDELGDTLADVISLGNKGGVSVEDLAEKIGIIGANARGAGLEGRKGFALMVGMLNIADNATGTLKKGIAGVSTIVEGLTTGAMGDSLKKNLHFDLAKARKDGLEFDDILGQIIEKSGGSQDKLATVFSGDALKVVTELAKVYQGGFEGAGGSKQDKVKAGWAAYEDAIQGAAKSSLTLADLQAEAAAEMETPEKKIATALEKLAQTFADPAVTDAFKQFAEIVPKVLEQAMKHPILTGALMSGVPQAMASSAFKSISEGVIKGGLGASIGEAVKSAGSSALSAFKSLMSSDVGGGLMRGLGVVGAGVGGFMVGKALADAVITPAIEEQERRADDVRAQSYEGSNMLSASRTMVGSVDEFGRLAKESSDKADELDARIAVAGGMDFGVFGNTDASASTYHEVNAYNARQRKRLGIDPNSTATFPGMMTVSQAETDRDNLGTLIAARDAARQAAMNFAARATGRTGLDNIMTDEDRAVMSTGLVHGGAGEQFGLGLGGPIKTNREKLQEQQAAVKEQKIANQQEQYAGLIRGITTAELKVRVMNPEDIRSEGKDGPKPGPEPR